MRRFKVDRVDGDVAYLRGREARHALKVLRLKKDDEIVVFDNKGKEYVARIEATSTQSARLRVLKETHVNRDSPLETTIFMALTNRLQKFEMALEKAVELGATNIVPVICRRSSNAQHVTSWSNKLRRWNDISISAAKQCGRNILPKIENPISLHNISNDSELSFVLYEKGGKTIKSFESLTPSSVSLLVGPEGGLEGSEVEFLETKGFKPIYLGKRILRAETAVIVGMTLVQFIWGDLST